MTTLARGISASATILDVSDESLNVARPFLATLDSETVRVRGLEYVSGAATRWNVDRGIDSTPATHAGGATVTLGDVAGPGGAAEAGTLVADPPELAPDLVAALGGANAPDGGNPLATIADVSGLLRVERTLSSAELLALFASPVELVPGAAGKVHLPFTGFAVFHPVSTPYTPAGDIAIGSQGNPLVDSAVIPNLLQQSVVAYGGPINLVGGTATAVGEALEIFDTSAEFTNGDGTLDLTVLYRTLDVS